MLPVRQAARGLVPTARLRWEDSPCARRPPLAAGKHGGLGSPPRDAARTLVESSHKKPEVGPSWSRPWPRQPPQWYLSPRGLTGMDRVWGPSILTRTSTCALRLVASSFSISCPGFLARFRHCRATGVPVRSSDYRLRAHMSGPTAQIAKTCFLLLFRFVASGLLECFEPGGDGLGRGGGPHIRRIACCAGVRRSEQLSCLLPGLRRSLCLSSTPHGVLCRPLRANRAAYVPSVRWRMDDSGVAAVPGHRILPFRSAVGQARARPP